MSSVPKPGFVQRTLSSFRSRNFRLFFAGQTISNTGNWLTMVTLTLLVLHRTGSGVSVGLLSACQFGPILFRKRHKQSIPPYFAKVKLNLSIYTS